IVVNLKFKNGALGSINVTTLTYPKNLEGSLTILGEKGTVRIGGVAMNKIETWQFADSNPMDESIHEVNTSPKSVYGFGHLDYYRNVVDILDGKAAPIVTGREARKTVEILEAAYKPI
ncbi:MAG: gfo/Idh/MocA family oxidoreductase, partial [Bacteroidales bacterium]|nr:gfo/Idh/MocA family oxidoreductase [Bacteroidales bacterium]